MPRASTKTVDEAAAPDPDPVPEGTPPTDDPPAPEVSDHEALAQECEEAAAACTRGDRATADVLRRAAARLRG